MSTYFYNPWLSNIQKTAKKKVFLEKHCKNKLIIKCYFQITNWVGTSAGVDQTESISIKWVYTDMICNIRIHL